jgi:hypothetical protein
MKKLVKDVLFGDEREKGYCERQPTPTSYYTTQTTSFVEATPVVYTSAAPQTSYSAPAVVEHIEKAPVVQEIIRPGVREEIQPVIHRDREQLEIREEIQPIYEKTVQPTVVEERQLPSETRPEVRLGSAPVIAEGPKSSTFVAAEQMETFTKPAIVEETIHKKIVEEIQPVIHREVLAPRVIHEVKPIYETVVDTPEVTYTTLPAVFREEQQQTQLLQRQEAPMSFQSSYSAAPVEGSGGMVREVKEIIIEQTTVTEPAFFQQK